MPLLRNWPLTPLRAEVPAAYTMLVARPGAGGGWPGAPTVVSSNTIVRMLLPRRLLLAIGQVAPLLTLRQIADDP